MLFSEIRLDFLVSHSRLQDWLVRAKGGLVSDFAPFLGFDFRKAVNTCRRKENSGDDERNEQNTK